MKHMERSWISGALSLAALCLLLESCGAGSASGPPPPPSSTPGITVSQTSLAFGNITVGTTSAVESVTVTNTGNATLIISSLTVMPSEFQLSSPPTLPLSLSPGADTNLAVTFKPDSAQSFTGSFTITSNASTSPTSVSLSGTGVSPSSGPMITVSPSSLAFGNVTVGMTSASQSVTATNTGNATLTISGLNITPSEFQLSSPPTLPFPLNPGASVTLSVKFAPDLAQSFTGSLTITSSAPTSPTVISLSGTGTSSTGGSTPSLVCPASINFGDQVTGSTSPAATVTLNNPTAASLQVTSVTPTGPFAASGFTGPTTLGPGQVLSLTATFTPTASGAASGTLSIATSSSAAPLTVSLSGTGVTTAPAVSISPAVIDFGNVAVGASCPPVTLTIINAGTSSITATGLGVAGPFLLLDNTSGFTLSAGQSKLLSVIFAPVAAGSASRNFGVIYTTGVATASLSGTGVTPNSLTVTTVSPLPNATQNAPYFATLYAAGGTPPYQWAVASGSSLPSGLSLSTNGNISGSANAAAGQTSFVARVTDSSSPPASAYADLELAIGSTLTSNCNEISFGSPPFIPMNDLGTGTFMGVQGGLYPGGSNTDPSAHQSAGVSLAGSIQPLDSNGNPSSSGKYVLVSIGMSNAREEFAQFMNLAALEPSLKPNLVIVNGAQSGADAVIVANPSSSYWTNLVTILNNAGVTPNQVVAAWVYEAIHLNSSSSSETFQQYSSALQSDLEAIARNLHNKFPNIKLAYFHTRNYGGYAVNVDPGNPEPFAYYNGFGVKAAIEDQINNACLANLNFDPTQCGGVVTAPWMAWAAYPWANGMTPRSDKLVWTCQDFSGDGTHPEATGVAKAADLTLNFFESDSSTTPWF